VRSSSACASSTRRVARTSPGASSSRTLIGDLGAARRAIVLLSDGAPTAGPSSAHALAAIARKLRVRASVTTLGYGENHDDDVLTAISENGGGTYQFIPDPDVCHFALAKAIGSQGEVVADQVELVIHPREGVRIKGLVGRLPVERDREGLVISLPDLLARDRRFVGVEIEFAPSSKERRTALLAEVSLRYRAAGSSDRGELRRTIDVELRGESAPVEVSVLHKILLLRADLVRKEARDRGDRGDFAGAAAILRAMIAEIQAAPGYAAKDGDPLFEACEQLLDDATIMDQRPSAAKYALYRRGQRSDLASNGIDASARVPQSARARMLASAVAGEISGAFLDLDGHRITLEGEAVIGRSRGCDIVIQSSAISRQHATIFPLDGDFFITDLGSTSGVMVNGRLVDVHRLQAGDEIRLGDRLIVFRSA
jgi:Ca-activated chloride channel homolog